MNISEKRLYRKSLTWLRLIFLFAIICSIFGCSNKKSILFKINNKQSVTSSLKDSIIASDSNYAPVIQIGDNLAISNLNNDALINGLGNSTPLSVIYRVNESGNIIVPTIGNVKVVGLTTTEVVESLTKKYEKTTLASPLFVVSITNLKVTVLGEFYRQGNVLLEKSNTSLIDVIGEVGGFNPRADKTKLKIIRGDRNNPEVIAVDLTNIASLGNPKLRLRNGDIIYIQPKNIYLLSDKISPILSYVGIGTSLLSLIFLLTRN